MIFHLNQHLVRITDIKRSFIETDNYTSPSLLIYYVNIDTQQSLTKILTPLSPHFEFLFENRKIALIEIRSIKSPKQLQ